MSSSSMTFAELRKSLTERQMSVQELVDSYRSRIAETDSTYQAYLEVFTDLEKQVQIAQQMVDDGRATALTGLPLAVKDNILIEGRTVTAGSKILAGYTAPYSATVIEKLKAEGVIFLGRANMDEFAMGSSTEHSAWQQTRNPRAPERVPGGSSGGSAAAVTADLALAALGSDTGGSIRQPAAFCGCVGLKPTYGAVSRSGLIAMGSSLDQIGPLTKTVTDAETLFYAIEGPDQKDSTTRSETVRQSARQSARNKKRIGVPWHLVKQEGVSSAVLEQFEQTMESLAKTGYEITDIKLPHAEYALAVYYVLMPAEVSSNMARFDGMRYGVRERAKDLLSEYMSSRALLGEEVKVRTMVGTFVLSAGYHDAYYAKARAARDHIAGDMEAAFTGQTGVDAIATPSVPTPAFKIGEKIDDPLQMYMSDIFTVGANIAGVPAISVPAGTVKQGADELPLGCHLMAPWFREDVLFALAKDLEKVN